MLPPTMRPDQVLQELTAFNNKLLQGLSTLSRIGPVDVGASARDAVYSEDKLVLYRFRPLVPEPFAIPVIVVYALVNRPYMADLQPDRSMIRRLLEAGLDVYLIDWGYPDGADRYLTLEDYICGYIRRCVDVVSERHGLTAINVLGICQGGTFSLCFSALSPERVKNLIVMVTPVDFHAGNNILSHWGRNIDVDLMVDTLGNVPGEILNSVFLALRPYRLTGQKYIDVVDILHDPEQVRNFIRMEKWIFDSPDQAGEAFRQFVKEFFQKNGLIKGEVTLGDQRVDLDRVTMPVLNIYATEDHLVPPDASKALKDCVGSKDYQEFTFKGGHIGIYVSSRAQRDIPAAIDSWLRARA
jgi:polyhydroxyalkanoate synthase